MVITTISRLTDFSLTAFYKATIEAIGVYPVRFHPLLPIRTRLSNRSSKFISWKYNRAKLLSYGSHSDIKSRICWANYGLTYYSNRVSYVPLRHCISQLGSDNNGDARSKHYRNRSRTSCMPKQFGSNRSVYKSLGEPQGNIGSEY